MSLDLKMLLMQILQVAKSWQIKWTKEAVSNATKD